MDIQLIKSIIASETKFQKFLCTIQGSGKICEVYIMESTPSFEYVKLYNYQDFPPVSWYKSKDIKFIEFIK